MGTISLQGHRTATASRTSKKGKVTLTARSRKGQKVVLTIKSGKSTKRMTARAR